MTFPNPGKDTLKNVIFHVLRKLPWRNLSFVRIEQRYAIENFRELYFIFVVLRSNIWCGNNLDDPRGLLFLWLSAAFYPVSQARNLS